MCHKCNYPELLKQAGLTPTDHRVHILGTIGDAPNPLSAGQIYTIVTKSNAINRVTVYRVLDNLVERDLVQRISSAGRAFFYGLAPNAVHTAHPHFYCKQCGRMDCLQPDAITLKVDTSKNRLSGEVKNIEIRIDGVCRRCLNTFECYNNGDIAQYI